MGNGRIRNLGNFKLLGVVYSHPAPRVFGAPVSITHWCSENEGQKDVIAVQLSRSTSGIRLSNPRLGSGNLINDRKMDILVLERIRRSLGEVTSQLT